MPARSAALLAYGVDLLVICVTLTAGLALTQFAVTAATPWDLSFESDGTAVIIIGFVWSAIYFGNSFVFGRTPGMSMLGLRIVRADGSPIDTRHALLRLVAFPLGYLTFGARIPGDHLRAHAPGDLRPHREHGGRLRLGRRGHAPAPDRVGRRAQARARAQRFLISAINVP